jgi:LuxR family quorum sensing-dependent transcriptional regulator
MQSAGIDAMASQFALKRDLEHLVFDTIEGADDIEDGQALTDHFRKACGKLGFTHLGAFSVREPSGRMIGGYQAGETDDAWAEHYVVQDHFSHDTVAHMLPTTLDVMVWSDLKRRERFPDRAKEIFNQAGEFGLEDGFVMPQHYINGAVAAAIMTAPQRISSNRRLRSAAHILAAYYGSGVRRLLAPSAAPASVHLSPRQRECLQWVRAGKSDWEIGEILSISEHTVKDHIDAARIKLGVRTRTQAVIEAIALRLIAL